MLQQEQKTVEREYQSFPPDMLVNKQASELPEGVDPALKEVCFHVWMLVQVKEAGLETEKVIKNERCHYPHHISYPNCV